MSDFRTSARSARLLAGAGALGAARLLAGCTSNDAGRRAATTADAAGRRPAATTTPRARPGHHRLLRARGRPRLDRRDHQERRGARPRSTRTSTFKPVEATNDVNPQICQVETLINEKVDAHGDPARRRPAADRGRPPRPWSRHPGHQPRPGVRHARWPTRTWIGGDNYGMGVAAGTLHRQELKDKDVANPVIGEIAGHRHLPLTQDRSQGFEDALKTYGFKVTPGQAAAVHRGVRPAGRRPTCCRPHRRSTRSGTTTTTRASACWPRSSRPTAASSSWSAAPARRTRCATSRPTTACSRPP